MLDESSSLGQFLQDLLLGTTISFDLTFTTNYSGTGDPDALVLMLLDPITNFTLVDTDLDANPAPIPFQDALLILALQGSGQITDGDGRRSGHGSAVPEPATLGPARADPRVACRDEATGFGRPFDLDLHRLPRARARGRLVNMTTPRRRQP